METKVRNLEDNTFLQYIRNGNKKFLGKLFEKYYVGLCRHALKFVRRKDIAEEIVQEFFIDLWNKRETLPEIISVGSYLYASVKNRSINFLNSPASRYQELNPGDFDQGMETTEEYMNVTELERIVAAGIDKLPPKCKAIFILNRQEGLTYQMIARELNISSKTVETQMAIALKRIKEHVESHWGELLILLLVALFSFLIQTLKQ